MKKLMFTLAIFSLVFTSAQAQKQLGGEHNVEVNLTPFGNSPIDGTTIKYRNFLDDDKAFRVSLTVGSTSGTYAYYQEGEQLGDPVSPQLNMETSNSLIGIAPGYEIHFSGTDNLSPYFGIEAYYMMGSRTDMIESWGPNDLDNVGQPDVYVTWDLTNKQAYSSMGLNLLFGADYYFSDAIYVGFEAGLGFGTTSFGNHTIETSDLTAFNIQFNGAFDPTTAGAAIADSFVGELPFNVLEGDIFYDYYEQGYTYPNQVSNTSLGNVFNGAIRVGFLFD
ncbi:MAG: hypothetical protein OSA04_00055 [Flavobacteriales bacterium]|nr:hypothetical protein [Flavobacteriales bacterium]